MARRPGNAGLQTGTAPRSGARRRTSQFRDGARLGTYPTRQSGQGTPVFTPAPPRAAGREGVLPRSGMAHVSAPTPPGRAARERRSSDRHRPAQRGERAYFPGPGWRTSRRLPHPAERPGNAGLQTGTAPHSGARGRTSQFRDGARLGAYPTRQSGQGTPVFRPAPPRIAGREGVLPRSRMAHVSAPTPPGRAARERRSSDRHRPA